MKQFSWIFILLMGSTLACALSSGDAPEVETQAPTLTASLEVQLAQTEQRSGLAGAWEATTGQSTLAINDGVRTDATGEALITFFTGDVTQLAPETELTIQHLGGEGGEQVSIDMVGGEIRNVVNRVMDQGDRFEVTTPAADAAVRGTIFRVRVDRATGQTTIIVEDGTVTVTPQVGAPVDVQAGFELDVQPGQAPTAPRPISTSGTVTPTSNATTAPTPTLPTPTSSTTTLQENALLTIVTPRSEQAIQNGMSLRVTGNARGITGQIQVALLNAAGETLASASTPVNAGDTLVPWSVDLSISFPTGTSGNGRILATAGTTSAGVRVQLGATSSAPPTNVPTTAPPAATQLIPPSATTAPSPTTAPSSTTAPTQVSAFITITTPKQGEQVSVSSFTVTGTAGALFENSLTVEVRDASGNVIAQQPVTYRSAEVGGTGSWQVTFQPGRAQIGTDGIIYAYATSARDGSIIAEARVGVTFQR